jgi:hypothetical protein
VQARSHAVLEDLYACLCRVHKSWYMSAPHPFVARPGLSSDQMAEMVVEMYQVQVERNVLRFVLVC